MANPADSDAVDDPPFDPRLRRKYRIRILIFLCGAVVLFASLSTLYRAVSTVAYLGIVESERDQWQRPGDVIAHLRLQEGAVVADVGSGAGYFTLKLSRLVGPRGRVVAVDIRKLPLFFLWIRARTSGRYNVRTIVGDQEDPRLPIGLVDAVLISNTYHEFQNPGSMLVHLSKSLRRGGRLVVLDHIATPLDERKDHPHELSPDIVDDQLREKGFEILERQDRFIVRSKGELWWLIEARLN